jgi:hypothetical protein
MKDLTTLTDNRKSLLTKRLAELQQARVDCLTTENASLCKLLTNLNEDIQNTVGNIKSLTKAVRASNRPGAIAYRQSLPDHAIVNDIVSTMRAIDDNSGRLIEIKRESGRLEEEERDRWKGSRKVTDLKAWFQTYGRPTRTITSGERIFSVLSLPVTHVAGASSKDGKVQFPFRPSSAFALRRGRLTY